VFLLYLIQILSILGRPLSGTSPTHAALHIIPGRLRAKEQILKLPKAITNAVETGNPESPKRHSAIR
jgi:hypothetical protein